MRTFFKVTAGAIIALASISAIASPQVDLKAYNCLSCHTVDKKLVGPSFTAIGERYRSDASARAKLIEKVKRGGSGAWGPVPMPANPQVPASAVPGLVDHILKQ